METQVRVFTIRAGELDRWVEEWNRFVRPLRERFGFRVEAAWVVRDENRFIWVLSYSGAGSWAERDAEYYASAERTRLSPDPARLIESAEAWFATPVPL
jgi:hypothetical protein